MRDANGEDKIADAMRGERDADHTPQRAYSPREFKLASLSAIFARDEDVRHGSKSIAWDLLSKTLRYAQCSGEAHPTQAGRGRSLATQYAAV